MKERGKVKKAQKMSK